MGRMLPLLKSVLVVRSQPEPVTASRVKLAGCCWPVAGRHCLTILLTFATVVQPASDFRAVVF